MAADPRFFPARGRLSLAAIAEAAGARFVGDATRQFGDVAPLGTAGPEEVAYFEGRRNAEALRATHAGAVLIAPGGEAELPEASIALLTDTPQLAFTRVAALFHPRPTAVAGIHPSAIVAPDAVIGEGVEIGAGAVVGARAEIGPGCIIGPLASIGPGCVLGEGCVINAQASMAYCLAGNRVVLHQGARIGNEGFGFVTTKTGEHVTVPQLGRVILGDGVEVGANSCVDRGAGGDTILGPGTRLDNLVQIGHNVKTGRGCVIVAQVGIAGSTELGDYVVIAAQAGLIGHIKLGNGARVGAQSGVMNDVPAGADVVGSPAWPAREFMRAIMRLKQLAARKDNGKTGGTP